MVGFMRKHVGEHGSASGPYSRPASAREFRDLALGFGGQSVGEHAETLRGAFSVRDGSLLHGAAVRIERGRTFQVRGGMLKPHETAVVQVDENRGDGAAIVALYSRRLRAPRLGVEVREQELIHCVVDGVGFQEDVANVD